MSDTRLATARRPTYALPRAVKLVAHTGRWTALGSPGLALAPNTETAPIPSGGRLLARPLGDAPLSLLLLLLATAISSPSGVLFLRGIGFPSLFLLCSPALGGAVTTEAEPSLRSTSP
ncbi:hypothetical protein TgHK011_001084 [Trichoderma gracile]|nr:hypothetical protein TgHK011_001084 [Trichoderma gracile]